MQLYGPLQNAALESLGTDPTTNVAGRIYWNSTTLKVMLDSGTSKRALLRNDGQAVFGTDATAANNIRLHHAGQAYLQFVTGDDTTAENILSTKIAQVGMRFPNFTTAAMPAVGNIGRVVFDTTVSTLKVDTGTAWTAIGPVFDSLTFTDQTADPAPVAGKTLFYTKNGSPYKVGSDGLVQLVGAGSGGGAGGFDYFTNGDFESGISTVSYATTTITNGLPAGTGPSISGTPNSVTASAETTSPIRKTTSLRLTAATAWTAGHGVALGPIFTMDRADLAKIITIRASYQVVQGSNGFVYGGTPGTQGLMLSVFDVTAGGYVPVPPGALGFQQNNGVGQVTATFQTSNIPGQRYQVFLFNAITSTVPVALLVDEVSMSRGAISFGAANTDLVQVANPVITAVTTAPSRPTTGVTETYRVGRAGDHAHIVWNYSSTVTTGSAVGSGDYLFSLPAGMSFDLNKVTLTGGGSFPVAFVATNGLGSAQLSDGASNFLGQIFPYDATRFRIAGLFNSGSTGKVGTLSSAIFPFGQAAVQKFSFDFMAPIAGWSTNTQVSSDTDTRVVAARMTTPAVLNVAGANQPYIFPVAQFDTHGAYSTSTGKYTIPVSGIYDLNAMLVANGAGFTSMVFKNNVFFGYLCTQENGAYRASGMTIPCVAGDLIDVRPDGAVQSTAQSYWSIKRLSGPSQIAASETVVCALAMTGSPSVAANAIVKYDTKTRDTHNAYDLTTGAFKVPVSGQYRISAVARYQTGGLGLYVVADGVGKGYLVNSGGNVAVAGASMSTYLTAGQTVYIYNDQAGQFQGPNNAGGFVNFLNLLSFERTGN